MNRSITAPRRCWCGSDATGVSTAGTAGAETPLAAPDRVKPSRGGMRWALEALVIDHLTIARVAAGLGVAWHTANDAVLSEGQRLLIDDPARFDAVRVIGVDEHVRRRTRCGDKYVTVIIDLTPARNKTGPAKLCRAPSQSWVTSTSSASPGTLVERQCERFIEQFEREKHVAIEATWESYQAMAAAYREPAREKAKAMMDKTHHRAKQEGARRLARTGQARPNADETRHKMCWRSSTGPAPATVRRRRSTAGSNTSAAPPSGFATSPTTSPEVSSRPEASDSCYILKCDEP
jgi:hypothetical protein